MIGIYKWTSPSGKSYIGQAINLKKRYKEFKKPNSYYTSKGSKIDNARSKYKDYENQWKYEILEECKIDDLDEKEKYWIKYYDSFKNGYNLTEGGDGTKGRVMEEWQKKQLSEKMIKQWKEGKMNSFFKKYPEWNKENIYIRTDEIKNKISSTLKEKYKNGEIISVSSRKIAQYNNQGELIRIFNSLQSACNSLGKKSSSEISRCAQGYKKTAYGYIWKYVE